ncbi:MAG TPA: cytochrome c3 family protein [Terriglobales bacterium]|nr:cytochrome c3 family protein [Terriglobales bacterium]
MRKSHLVFAVLLCMIVAAVASTAFAQAKAPSDVIMMKGGPMGGVKFLHNAHAKDRNIKCDVCHHVSKPEKPSKAAVQLCADCHTKTATPPMKTRYQAAFHNPTSTSGLCIDCHKKGVTASSKAPTKCTECHHKANV